MIVNPNFGQSECINDLLNDLLNDLFNHLQVGDQ